MASFVKKGEHYFKSLNVLKEKSDNFVRTIEIVRNHMASVIQRLTQNQSCFNILSVGSGTGEMDMEILKVMKEELQRTQGRDQIKIYNRAIEPSEYACDLYKSAVKRVNDQQIVLRRQQTISRRLKKLTVLILRLLKLTCSDNNS